MNEPAAEQHGRVLANKPISTQVNDISTSELDATQDNSTSTPIDFWHSFRLFPLQFDESGFTHWYLFVIGPYLILLIVSLTIDIRRGLLNWNDGFYYLRYGNSFTRQEFTDWIFFSVILTLSLAVLAFNNWRRSIPMTLQMLLNKRRINITTQDKDINAEYARFLEQYQQTLLSKKRYILIAVCMIAILVLTVGGLLISIFPSTYISYFSYDFFYGSMRLLYTLIWNILSLLLWSYFVAVASWAVLVTGSYIRKLTSQFDLNIQPGHPDHCGGLKLLGNFCLGMALPLLIGIVFLGFYSFTGIIHNSNAVIYIAANVALFLFLLPIATIAFFTPIWNIHQKMEAKKEAYDDEFAENVIKLEERVRSSLTNGEVEKAKSAKEELEIMQILHPDKIDYPVWPFDRRILITFLAPQTVAIASLIVQIGQWLFH